MEQHCLLESPAGTMVDPAERPSNQLHDSAGSSQTAASRYLALSLYGSFVVNGAVSSATTDVQDVGKTMPSSALSGTGCTATVLTEDSHPPEDQRRVAVASTNRGRLDSEPHRMGSGCSEIEGASRAPDLQMDQGYFVLGGLGVTVVKSVDAGGGPGAPREASDPGISSAASHTVPA